MNTQQPPSQTQQRKIRVFVSSTFRDMQAERDELVKFIFPQLRKLCEQRGVAWGEVDLRWGITDEQKSEGMVLPICLDEIKRCRPFFIGLLGERYGWVVLATWLIHQIFRGFGSGFFVFPGYQPFLSIKTFLFDRFFKNISFYRWNQQIDIVTLLLIWAAHYGCATIQNSSN